MSSKMGSLNIQHNGYNADVERIRDEEYPMLKDSIYLDHAGTTPYPKSLMDRFAQEMTANLFGNPHSASVSSQLSTQRIQDIRLRALQFFNADPADFDLVFVANATAGIKLVVEAMRCLPTGFDYVYHQASHTSLVGVREEAKSSVCLDTRQMEDWLFGSYPFDDYEDAERPILFAYPAQSNMDGRRFPLSSSSQIRRQCQLPTNKRKAYTLLDAAALVSSSPLDLSNAQTAPDFVVLSFYKIFGFPDLGALLVRKEVQDVFSSRRYFGGGTVDMVVCLKEQWHAPKDGFLHERLEDGTLPIHSIIALDIAMDVHAKLFESMERVAGHTGFLARRLYQGLKGLRHANDEMVCAIYSPDPETEDSGPVVAFNIRNAQGIWISLAEVEKLATLKGIHIRTGGVCNPGGIASALGLEPWEMKQNFSSGFRCGMDNDNMGGKPTGIIRVSLGAMSTIADVDRFVQFVEEFYREDTPPTLPPPETKLEPSLRNTLELYIKSIVVYPIKSCAGFHVPPGIDWEVHPEGLAWDREWCLVHRGSGQALSQKRYARMALLRPNLDFTRGELQVTYAGDISSSPGLPSSISVPLSKNPKMYAPKTSGMSATPTQEAQGPKPRRILLSNESPILAITSTSVDALNQSIALFNPSVSQPISEAVFRANLVLSPSPSTPSASPSNPLTPSPSPSTTSKPTPKQKPKPKLNPYEEDTWSSLTIFNSSSSSSSSGNQKGTKSIIKFQMLGSCRRCHMVCIDQTTGSKTAGGEPFVTLSKTRRFEGKVFFGVHMGKGGTGTGRMGGNGRVMKIRVGDVVRPSYL
ncbi:pyridoxal phosphate-dependent transferase [Neurospora hispaniola]|uniref:Molybdenum cofactor sulfurase n=1 Tax=Neurospora hispaniola TaxID=588809 RepID=A0AAJ0IE83_9PEZI|nr:pyridoxal phosphate-dependent transferase [Neurospora hispaniola]